MRGRPHSARAVLLFAGLALFVALLVPAIAGADVLTPEAGPTQNAIKTDTLYKIVFVIGLVVIGLVWAVVLKVRRNQVYQGIGLGPAAAAYSGAGAGVSR